MEMSYSVEHIIYNTCSLILLLEILER